MMYVLEAHPDNKDTGLFLAGKKGEIKRLNRALLAGTLGAMAANTTGIDLGSLLYFVSENHSRGKTIQRIPRRLTSAVGAVLGDKVDVNLNSRLDLLLGQTIAGHLTSDQPLKEMKILHDLTRGQLPQWLTHDGMFASFLAGSIVADLESVEGSGLSEPESRIAEKVGADTYVYQTAVSGNTSALKALPTILSSDHLTFGNITPGGVFDPLVTALSLSGYKQNFPANYQP